MKKSLLVISIFIFFWGLNIPAGVCKVEEESSTTIQIRAISLRVLQERLEAHGAKGPRPKELLHFAGITRVEGYVVDEVKHDVILFGQVNPTLPPLYLDDFVIALRNATLKYAHLKGNTYYYSDPGCSIDPDPKVMGKLDSLAGKIIQKSYPGGIDKGIEEWHDICRSPQQVRVLGIPFHTHFSKVMVKADYDMKGLVDGCDDLDIPGFDSLSDITLAKAKSYIIQGKPIPIPLSSMNRFWFYPGENLYEEDEGIILI